MSMRDLHLGFQLDFDSPETQEVSEDILMRLLGLNCRLNLAYLRLHPDTPSLYDSGVVYTEPDQADGRPPLKKSDVRKLLALLRKMGCDEETALMIVRMLKGIEIFLDIPAMLRRGKGDCNELVPWRVAELWRAGVPATPYLTKEPNDRGGLTYHAIVQWPDGSAEDVSLILGMGGPARAADRREEIRKNAERAGNYINAGQTLITDGDATAAAIGATINALCLAPRDGVFRSPYRKAA